MCKALALWYQLCYENGFTVHLDAYERQETEEIS